MSDISNTNTNNTNDENINFHENSQNFSDNSSYSEYSDNVGKILQDARIKQNLDTKAVAQAIKISVRQVDFIENQQWDKLPENLIIKGFVRNYAKFLKLDADEIVKKLANHNLDKSQILEVDNGVDFEKTHSLNSFYSRINTHISKKLFVILALIIIIGVIAGLLWSNFSNISEIPNLNDLLNSVSETDKQSQDDAILNNNSNTDTSTNTTNTNEVITTPPETTTDNNANVVNENSNNNNNDEYVNPYQ